LAYPVLGRRPRRGISGSNGSLSALDHRSLRLVPFAQLGNPLLGDREDPQLLLGEMRDGNRGDLLKAEVLGCAPTRLANYDAAFFIDKDRIEQAVIGDVRPKGRILPLVWLAQAAPGRL